MAKRIALQMEVDEKIERVEVGSLYEAGSHVAAFIRNLDLEKHTDAEIGIRVVIEDRPGTGPSVEF